MAIKSQLTQPVPGAYRGAMKLGDEQYLWILVAVEVAVLALLRNTFRRNHGG